MGSLVTTSRTATPAQTQLWNAWHQCSAPLISTGPCASSAVPMPFVPAAHSDQQNQGARLESVALASVAWSPHSARIRPVASVTVTTPPRLPTSCATDGGPETQLGEDDVVFGRVVELRDGDRSLGEVRVDPVLLPAAMPGDRHLGPDARDVILALHEPFPRREHGAPARARRHGLEPMYIPHGGEPPLVHPQRPTACARSAPVAARRGRAYSGLGTASRVFLLRHSFRAVSQTGTPTLSTPVGCVTSLSGPEQEISSPAVAGGGYSNLRSPAAVMRFNKGIAANTTTVDRANPPTMVR